MRSDLGAETVPWQETLCRYEYLLTSRVRVKGCLIDALTFEIAGGFVTDLHSYRKQSMFMTTAAIYALTTIAVTPHLYRFAINQQIGIMPSPSNDKMPIGASKDISPLVNRRSRRNGQTTC